MKGRLRSLSCQERCSRKVDMISWLMIHSLISARAVVRITKLSCLRSNDSIRPAVPICHGSTRFQITFPKCIRALAEKLTAQLFYKKGILRQDEKKVTFPPHPHPCSLFPLPQPFPLGEAVCICSANPATSSSASLSVVLPRKPFVAFLGKELLIQKNWKV